MKKQSFDGAVGLTSDFPLR